MCLNTFDPGNRVFNRFGNLRLYFGWRGTELRDRDRDDREIDIGNSRDRQIAEALEAENNERDGQERRCKRIFYCPGRNVDRH